MEDLDDYNAVLDMDADFYLDTIRVVFQDFCLVNGTWDVKGVNGKIERVRPQDIKTTALFSVEGELDDISGSGQTEAVHSICSGVDKSMQKHLEVPGAGHYGIFSGRRWRDVVYPQVKDFILGYHNAAIKNRLAEEAAAARASTKVQAAPVAAAKPVAAEPVAVTPSPVAVVKTAKPVVSAAKPAKAVVASSKNPVKKVAGKK